MPTSRTRTKKPATPRGHPDPLMRQLHRTVEDCVELVRDLKPRLNEDQHVELRAGALGMLITLGVLTGKPDPRELYAPEKEDSHA